MLEPPRKATPHPRTKEKQQDSRRGAITFKIKPHTCQRLLEGINKISCAPKPTEKSSDPHKRLSQTCLWVCEGLLQRQGSAVASHRDRNTGRSSAGRHNRGNKSSWRRPPLAPLQSCQTGGPPTGEQLHQRRSHAIAKVLGPTTGFQTWDLAKGLGVPRESDFECQWDLIIKLPQDWGNRLLEGKDKTICAPGPRRKEQWPHKRLSQTSLWVFGSLQHRHGSTNSGLPQGQRYWQQQSWEAQCTGTSPCGGGHHYPTIETANSTSGQTTGREHSPTHQQEIGLKIYWAWPCPPDQDLVFPTASPSHQDVRLWTPIPQRADIMETTIRENEPKWWPCITQWNFEPCHIGPPKTAGLWQRDMTKRGSLEKEMANHFSILALRTPWTVWKGKNIWHWKMNPLDW